MASATSNRRRSKPPPRPAASQTDTLVLTPRQLQILTFVRDYRRRHGYAPTMQELADAFHISKVTVFEHIEVLEKKGLLRRLPHKARSLMLTARATLPDENPTRLPLAGQIAAGVPIEAVQDDESIDLQELFATRSGCFVLRVRGDSMLDEQIRDGDYVIVERRTEPRDGETVVALLESGEATLKKFYRQDRRIRLEPANARYAPMYVDADRVQIQGVVVGVIRKY